jgi:diaminobutyrate-2-oxoglutarate transaminase
MTRPRIGLWPCAPSGRVSAASEVRRRRLADCTFSDKERANRIARRAFELGLLIETSGPESEVVKLLPSLTITEDELDEGLTTLARAVRETA